MIPRYVLAPYLATPPEVVERMIELADVRPADQVYDIGCGDGRVAIAAARRGAKCLGVDVAQCWIEASRQNALAAGVAHLTRFEERDATELDFRSANVIFFYLVHSSTQYLARLLAAQCAPGTRVVSHSFPFTGVGNVRTDTVVDAAGERRQVHLWVVQETPKSYPFR